MDEVLYYLVIRYIMKNIFYCYNSSDFQGDFIC
jgi:hypothetical protein